ncbi:MAG: DUF4326 domain-containing protein [Thiomargarita sp.]|nr:DUF4326 domain-containing protein [Thiomargarita sp.]
MPTTEKYDGDMSHMITAMANTDAIGFYPKPIMTDCVNNGYRVSCPFSGIKGFEIRYGVIPWYQINTMRVKFVDEFFVELENINALHNLLNILMNLANQGYVHVSGLGYFFIPDPNGRPNQLIFREKITTRRKTRIGWPTNISGNPIVIPKGYSITDDCVIDYELQTFDCEVREGIPGITATNLNWLDSGCFTIRLKFEAGVTQYYYYPYRYDDEGGRQQYNFLYDYTIALKQEGRSSFGRKLYLNFNHPPGIVWLHGGNPPDWDGGGKFSINGQEISSFLFPDGWEHGGDVEVCVGGTCYKRGTRELSDSNIYEAEYCIESVDVDLKPFLDKMEIWGNGVWAGALGIYNPDYESARVLPRADEIEEYNGELALTLDAKPAPFNYQNEQDEEVIKSSLTNLEQGAMKRIWEAETIPADFKWAIENTPGSTGDNWNVLIPHFSSGDLKNVPVEEIVYRSILVLSNDIASSGLWHINDGVPDTIEINPPGTITYDWGPALLPSDWIGCQNIPEDYRCPYFYWTENYSGGQIGDLDWWLFGAGSRRTWGERFVLAMIYGVRSELYPGIMLSKPSWQEVFWEGLWGETAPVDKMRMDYINHISDGKPIRLEDEIAMAFLPHVGAAANAVGSVTSDIWSVLMIPEQLIVAGMNHLGISSDYEPIYKKYKDRGESPKVAEYHALSESWENAAGLMVAPTFILSFSPGEWVQAARKLKEGATNVAELVADRNVRSVISKKLTMEQRFHNIAALKNTGVIGVFSTMVNTMKQLVEEANGAIRASQKMQIIFVNTVKSFEKKVDLQKAVTIALKGKDEKDKLAMLRRVAEKYKEDFRGVEADYTHIINYFDELMKTRRTAYEKIRETTQYAFENGLPNPYIPSFGYFAKWHEANNRFLELKPEFKHARKIDTLNGANADSIPEILIQESWLDDPPNVKQAKIDMENGGGSQNWMRAKRYFMAHQYKSLVNAELKSNLFRKMKDIDGDVINDYIKYVKTKEPLELPEFSKEIDVVIRGVGPLDHLLNARAYILEHIFRSQLAAKFNIKKTDDFLLNYGNELVRLKTEARKAHEMAIEIRENGKAAEQYLVVQWETYKKRLQHEMTALRAGDTVGTLKQLTDAAVASNAEVARGWTLLRQANEEVSVFGGKDEWLPQPMGRDATIKEMSLLGYEQKTQEIVGDLYPKMGEGMRVGVVGGRNVPVAKGVGEFIGSLRPCTIVSGGCSGADAIGEAVADHYGIPKLIFPAKWKEYKKASKRGDLSEHEFKVAGLVRNTTIAEKSEVVVVIASSLMESKGTYDTFSKALSMNKPVYFWDTSGHMKTGWIDPKHPFWPSSKGALPSVVSKYEKDFAPNDTQVVNIMRGSDFYGTTFGNPYKIGTDGNRAEVIKKYKEKILPKLMKTEAWQHLMVKWVYGGGVKLACCCAPKPCHGDVIAEAMRQSITEGWEPNPGLLNSFGYKHPQPSGVVKTTQPLPAPAKWPDDGKWTSNVNLLHNKELKREQMVQETLEEDLERLVRREEEFVLSDGHKTEGVIKDEAGYVRPYGKLESIGDIIHGDVTETMFYPKPKSSYLIRYDDLFYYGQWMKAKQSMERKAANDARYRLRSGE